MSVVTVSTRFPHGNETTLALIDLRERRQAGLSTFGDDRGKEKKSLQETKKQQSKFLLVKGSVALSGDVETSLSLLSISGPNVSENVHSHVNQTFSESRSVAVVTDR